MNDLRIGLVGPLPPPNGGMAMQTEQLARLLRADGISVEQVATNGPYRPAAIARLPGLRALFRLIPYLASVWRLAGRVEVIHLMANSGWSWQLYAAPVLWLAWLRSTPVVVNYRGGEAHEYFQRSFSRVRPSLRKAAAVVVPSGYLEAVFRQFGQDTQVIPNIIDRAIFRETAKDSITEPAKENPGPAPESRRRRHFTLVITRNLEAIYAIDTAIRALALVHASDSGVRLRIAGSGPAEAQLRALAAELGLADAVSFEGRLDRPAIAALYAAADAMINPSTVDNMPNSVIESLACGVPVISTDVGGVPFIVTQGESALLVPARDETALAAAILRLKGDELLRARLRANGLAQVEQYSWPRVRRQWLDLYRRLCPHNRREVA
ncbi:MAG: glycosyltransferase family 4 protein [Porticoccaceae bacterium]|jgi:glycosyltransferase involved in cell wall biosynthesis